jgi:hypothetical protein
MSLVYFTTLWIKSWGSHWKDFSATWYTARLEEFYRFPVPQFMKEPPVVQLTSAGTLITEFALATFVFYRPTRKWVLLGGILMHAFIEYSMNVPLFAFLMCSWYIAFYEGEEVVAWAKQFGTRFEKFRVTLTVPATVPENVIETLTAIDCFGLVQIQRGSKWSAVTAEGKEIDPHRALWTRLPGAWLWSWAVRGRWRNAIGAGVKEG